jgi:hypothetical protein
MVSAVVALLVGVILTIALLVFLANVIPVPAPDCPGGTGGSAGSGGSGAPSTAQATTGPAPAPAPAPPAAPPAATQGTNLTSPGQLNDGQAILSPNGQAQFTYKYGQLIITQGSQQLWVSPNPPVQNGVFMLKSDGTMGLFPSQYSVSPVWNAGTTGKGTGPYTLSIQDSGNLLLFDATPSVVWSAPIGSAAPTAAPTFTLQNMTIANSSTILATSNLAVCQALCLGDISCAGFTRSATALDTASSPCYKFTRDAWTAPGAQSMSTTYKAYLKSS